MNILPLISVSVICFGIMMYVILDGFDLGIGILFPFVTKESSRDVMLNSIAPVWDGNETWLVFGGATLYTFFPKAYGQLLPVLYLPIMMMLFALILRGVAFEFRFKAENKFVWNACFSGGAFIATFMQGMMLGTFIKGFDPNWFQQNPLPAFVWISPFSLFIGFALASGYALLGATWLILKTSDKLQQKMRHHAKRLLCLVAMNMLIVSMWTPWQDQAIFLRWFTLPNFIFLSPLPISTLMACLVLWYSIERGYQHMPFLMTVLIFLCGYIGIAISLFPYIIPRMTTIWDAASPADTQLFLLGAVAIMLPPLLAYTGYAYYVFKGKADETY